MLSGLSVGELIDAVALQETGRLVKIPGIGKKTAERLMLELKDKLDGKSNGSFKVQLRLPLQLEALRKMS